MVCELELETYEEDTIPHHALTATHTLDDCQPAMVVDVDLHIVVVVVLKDEVYTIDHATERGY